jgi:hypothetical protein
MKIQLCLCNNNKKKKIVEIIIIIIIINCWIDPKLGCG